MKTLIPKKEKIQRNWYVVDAEGAVLGRLASQIARVLKGKHKPEYTPHLDVGDHVVVINAEKIRVTGKKTKGKIYTRYTGYPGGLRETNFGKAQIKKPEWVVEHAIKGMLPHNPLGRAMFRKLKVYTGASHPHHAQQPQPLSL
jgi:large subunit ribosomal protein L13